MTTAFNNCPVDIKPLSQSDDKRNPTIFSLNYTNQEFWGLKARLIEFIRERFGPSGTVIPNTFDDFVESDIAIMLIENWAFIADMLSFKIDQIANEIFIDTVTEVENAFRLAKLVGFSPTPPIAAKSMWMASLPTPQATDVLLPAPHRIRTSTSTETINMELFPATANGEPIFDEDIVIPAGSTQNTSIVGLEGHTTTNRFVGDGTISQTFELLTFPIIYDSVRVWVDGVAWQQVEYFSDSQPRREFRVEYTSNYNGFIMFGNNRAGMIPSTSSQIQVDYRVGGGVVGNIVSGYIRTQMTGTLRGQPASIPIVLTNYTSGKYGYDGDTIEDIRQNLPAWIRTQHRAVTGADYKTISEQYVSPYNGQVGKATAVLRNYGCAGNVIDIYVLALESSEQTATGEIIYSGVALEPASNELKVNLAEEINSKKMLTDYVCIRDGQVIYADITIEVSMDRFYRKFEDEYRESIQNKTNSFFLLSHWDYGQILRDMDLIKEFSDLRQIDTYTLNFVTDDENNSGTIVTAKFYEIIRPDSIAVTFSYT